MVPARLFQDVGMACDVPHEHLLPAAADQDGGRRTGFGSHMASRSTT